MAKSTIWERLEQSGLESSETIREWTEDFQRSRPPAAPIDDEAVANWLVESDSLTKYQVAVLKAGHSGPFFYGDYRVDDRYSQPPRKGVFRAVHGPTGHRVLLRFVAADATDQTWTHLKSTVNRLGSIDHPHLVHGFAVVDLTEFRFGVLEETGGKSLAEILSAQSKVSTKKACVGLFEIAAALACMHRSGWVHGDIRPENILVDDGGHFHLWKDPVDQPRSLFAENSLDATEMLDRSRYLAPELAAADQVPDPKCDVYALGCIFYQLLSGRAPFAADDAIAMMQAHATEATASIKSDTIPGKLEELIAFMMAKNSEVRHADAGVVETELGKLLQSAKVHPGELKRVPTATEKALREWIKSHGNGPPPPPRQPVGATDAAMPSAAAPPTAPTVAAAESPVIEPEKQSADFLAEVNVQSESSASALFDVADEDKSVSRKRTRKKKPAVLWVAGACLFVLLGGAGTWIAIAGNSNGTSDDQTADGDGNASDPDQDQQNGTGPPTTDVAFDQNVVDDDGQSLWETPTQGEPLTIEFLPPSVRVILSIRLADLLSETDGPLVIQSLGPQFPDSVENWEAIIGVELDQIEHLLIGFHDNDGNKPRPSYRVKLKNAVPLSDLKDQWGGQAAGDYVASDQTWWQGDRGLSFLTINERAGSSDEDSTAVHVDQFIAATDADIDSVVKVDGAPPNIRQELRQLLRYSDRTRHLSILALPNTLFNDEGRQLFGLHQETMVDALDALIGDSVGAVMFSAHLDQELYLEMMLKPTLDIEPPNFADTINERVDRLVADYSQYVFTLQSNPYWDRVRMRFANWMSMLGANTRYGVENRIVIANCWMPSPAAHNLIAATELALASTNGGGSVPVVDPVTPEEESPETVAELLERKLDLEIPRNDLVLILEELKATIIEKYPDMPFEFDIRLMGNDLQLEGITQNQSVTDFSMVDRPIHEILTGLLVRAYTAPGVDGPSDPGFLLIWVIAPDPDAPDNEIVLITTRPAAAREAYVLPEAFRVPPVIDDK